MISFVIPVYNEQENIHRAHEALCAMAEELKDRYDAEFIFTDNHSTDRSFEMLRDLTEKDPRVRSVRFSRNFGYQASIFTGYLLARGNAAVQIDCDLEDPPEVALKFIEYWEQGHHVVYGIRKSRHEARSMTLLRKLFYMVINRVSEDDLPRDAGDFRLIDRRVLNELAKFRSSKPYLRGTIAAMGFRQLGVPYHRAPRVAGESKFNFRSNFALAWDGILSHSTIPLRLASYFGLTVSALAVLVGLVYLVLRLTIGVNWPAGFTTLALLQLFGIAVNALFLGIIGEYLNRIFKQVQPHPLTIIETLLNVSDTERRDLERRLL